MVVLSGLSGTAFAQASGPAGTSVNLTPPAAPDKSAYSLFDPTPDAALRSFNSDRPTKSDVPFTVDAGHFQYETDLFNYLHSNAGGVTTRVYTVADPVLKFGLTDRIELDLQFTGYSWETVRAGAKRASAQGAGDLILRSKINVFGNEGSTALALIPYVKFPTAAQGIGNGQTEGGVIAPFSHSLPWGFTVLVMPEVDVLKNANDDGHHFNFTQLINLSHAIGSKLTAYAEVYSALGTDRATPPVYTFDAALEYAITPSLEADIGVNAGLNRAAPNLQAYTGLAQRF